MRRLTTLVAVTVLVAACGDGGGATTTTAAAVTTTAGPAGTTTTGPGATSSTGAGGEEMGEGVHLADSSLGQILVDAEGMTLYVFTVDNGGESQCYDSCAQNWPAVPGDTTAAGLDASAFEFGTTERTDGTTQLTVNGQPLYYFAGDSAPGDVNGQGLNDVWYVVGADGEMVAGEPPAESQSTLPDDYGY